MHCLFLSEKYKYDWFDFETWILCGSWLPNWPIASTSPSYYLKCLLALYFLKYYVTVYCMFTLFIKHYVYFALQVTILQAMLQGLRNFSGLFFLLFQSSIGFLNFTYNMNMGYQTFESWLRCVIRHIEHQGPYLALSAIAFVHRCMYHSYFAPDAQQIFPSTDARQ